jgi:hypothetical protein
MSKYASTPCPVGPLAGLPVARQENLMSPVPRSVVEHDVVLPVLERNGPSRTDTETTLAS